MEYLSITVYARSNKLNELLSAIRSIADKTSHEKGCIGYNLSQDIDNMNRIYIEETFENREFLDRYLCSDIFSALLGSVKFLGKTHEIRINCEIQSERFTQVKR
jgi:quinol monooxygenase YgiN